MEYQVILTQNGKLKKILHKGKNKSIAFTEYREHLKKSDEVIFEQKFTNNNGIIPVEYRIYIVKELVDNENRRFLKDYNGELIEEEPLFGQWHIIDSNPFKIEENLWVYGFNPKKDRKTIKDVLPILVKGLGNLRTNKEIIVCHNKLIIYNEDYFDMVICKCLKDAQRLHHLLYSVTKANKIKRLLFMGTASPATVSILYEIIHEETGWPMTKVRRTTTRP